MSNQLKVINNMQYNHNYNICIPLKAELRMSITSVVHVSLERMLTNLKKVFGLILIFSRTLFTRMVAFSCGVVECSNILALVSSEMIPFASSTPDMLTGSFENAVTSLS